MLTNSSHLVLIHVFGNTFQEGFLHHLLRDLGDVEQRVALQIFLPYLKMASILVLFQSLGTLPSRNDSSKIIEIDITVTLVKFLSTHGSLKLYACWLLEP